MKIRFMKKAITPIIIILAAGGATAAMVWQKKEPEKNEVTESVILVDTTRLRARDMHFTITSQGNVSPRTETTLVSEISGVVQEASHDFVAGGFFRKGEILLKLEPSDYEVAVQQARANLLTMKARLAQEEAQAEQAAKEWDMSGRPRNQAPSIALRTPYLEEARANVLFAEADLKKAERKLEQTVIRAPYDGMIKEKLVDVGQYVTTGTQVAQTFAVDFAEVRLPLTDNDIAYIELPGPAETGSISAEGMADIQLTSVVGGNTYKWPAKLVRTEGVIDERTRVHYAVASVQDPYCLKCDSDKPPLPMGSFVRASIESRLVEDVIAIPLQAVRGMDQVLVKDENDRLRIYQVSVIRTDADYVYVKASELDDKEVITSAVYNPVNGMRVHQAKDS